ncbi:hypothetical protein, partial [Enterococcus faecalis]|uniref:hypothetical protein n=1 Tax=Enterococcus faecalis TaxID=1351 RepID=UPI003CC589E5
YPFCCHSMPHAILPIENFSGFTVRSSFSIKRNSFTHRSSTIRASLSNQFQTINSLLIKPTYMGTKKREEKIKRIAIRCKNW